MTTDISEAASPNAIDIQRSSGKHARHGLLWLGLTIAALGALTYFIQHTTLIKEFDTGSMGLYIVVAGVALSSVGFAIENWIEDVGWRNSLGLRIVPISLALALLYVGATYGAYRQEEIQFANGDVALAGSLYIPRGEGPHPAVVLMHGAGQADRRTNISEAQSLARDGVAALIYDKRGSGASVGGHYRFDGYEALADDGVAAFNYLMSRDDIDLNQIGLWGTSEAGWTAPLAAAQIEEVAFLIIITGGPVTPAEQGDYEMMYRLRKAGFSDSVIDQALTLRNQYNGYIRTGLGHEELVESIQQSQNEDWFEVGEIPSRVPAYDELTEWDVWWKGHMDIDVAPLLTQMDFPILFVLGANDVLVPSQLVKARVEGILGEAGHEDYTVEIFPEATHNIVASPPDCSLCLPDSITGIGPTLPWFAPGYLDAVSDWVQWHVEISGAEASS